MVQLIDTPSNKPKRIKMGLFHFFPTHPLQFFDDVFEQGVDTAWIKFLHLNAFVTRNPVIVKHVLQDNHKNYKKSLKYSVLRQFLGNGLVTSEGDFWKKQRRLAQPAFHKKRIDNIVDITNNYANELVADWQQLSSANNKIDFSQRMAKLTIQIVTEALFGTNIEDKVKIVWENLEILNEGGSRLVRRPFDIPEWLPLPFHLRLKKARDAMDEIVYGFINQRREEQRKGEAVRHDLLSMLMEATDEETGEGMSNIQLRDEVMTLFTAGHETTVVALSWIIFLLGQHPKVYKKLQAEVDAVLAHKNSVDLADLPQLPYTYCIINEAMRLYPPVPFIGRNAQAPDSIAGYDIGKNGNVLINVWAIHRSPKLWKQAEQFIPDRFMNYQAKGLDNFKFLPFAHGPRKCIGFRFAEMEMIVTLALLAKNFNFELVNEELVETDPMITLRAKPTITVRVIKRTR